MFDKDTMERVDLAINELCNAVTFSEKYGKAITHVSTNTLKKVLITCRASLDAHLAIHKQLKKRDINER